MFAIFGSFSQSVFAQSSDSIKNWSEGDIIVFRANIFQDDDENTKLLKSNRQKKKAIFQELEINHNLQFYYVMNHVMVNNIKVQENCNVKILEISPNYGESEFKFTIEVVGPPGSPKLIRT